ncbi:unnamed protein product [Tilletia controversa]|uniref:Uncharacterized protein n=1 Tax=Tilletia caries TaxID=13290 RepID=A0A177V571_9BASI|nr:hypothetical protein CF335_g318 [Tilletia laevis]KAE8264893.1 hypothetical protein A4X03_0g635 [Tilletia caries]CAD6959322.1 unnamed protein product [Tilletia controversa]CAD6904386.1 unnamed protein product [Tilletia caries]CAD6918996.1 unnamed protein product [Tilletia laevis]
MLFYKSALLVFTTLALGTTVSAVAIQDPVARELDIITGNVALNIRGDDLAAMGLTHQLIERDPRKKPKKVSAAALKGVKSSANQIEAATSELRKFRKTHKKTKVSKSRGWFGQREVVEERDVIEERSRKSKNVADLRKTLRKVNQHLLDAASQLRKVNRRDFYDDDVILEKRALPVLTGLPVVTDLVPAVTDVLTNVVPIVTDLVPAVTDVLTNVVPIVTDLVPVVTDLVPVVTDLVPVVTDILPTLPVTLPTLPVTLPTDIIPTLTVPTTAVPTNTLPPLTGLAALLAALRALLALIRAFIRELVGAILDIFVGGSNDRVDPSVLREVSPGLAAVFGAASDVANSASPAIGGIVDGVLKSVRGVLSGFGLTF